MGNIDVFERIAANYDTMERQNTAKIIARELNKYIIEGESKTAVDYGCGTGLIGFELQRNFKSILFVDASKKMIEVVEQKILRSQMTNAKTVCLDLETTLQPSFKVDYIFLVQVLLHVTEIEPLIENLYQSLNDGGHLLIVDFDYNESVVSEKVHSGFEQKKLAQFLEQKGFSHSKAVTFYQGEKMFMNQDASLFILDATKVVK